MRDLLRRFTDHLGQAVSRMILLLQKLGEEPPVSRSLTSRLQARWGQQQQLLREFAFGSLTTTERNAVVAQLAKPRMEVAQ